jgi:hypothetical protein
LLLTMPIIFSYWLVDDLRCSESVAFGETHDDAFSAAGEVFHIGQQEHQQATAAETEAKMVCGPAE